MPEEGRWDPREVAELRVNGMTFRDWESVMVRVSDDGQPPYARFRASEREATILPKRTYQLQIRPGDTCEVRLAGNLAFKGIIHTRNAAYSGHHHAVEFIAMGMTLVLREASAVVDDQEFREKNLKQITERVLQKFKIKLRTEGVIPEEVFKRVHIQPFETAYEFLERLTRMRGVLFTTNAEGDVVYVGPGAKADTTDLLKEGENILEGRELWTIPMMFPQTDMTSQGQGDNDNNGPEITNLPWYQKELSRFFKEVTAPFTNVTRAEEPTSKPGGLKNRGDYDAVVRGQESLLVQATVQGWLRSVGNGLWWPGQKPFVDSPMLIVKEAMWIIAVTFTQDNHTGSRTIIDLSNKRAGDKTDYSDPGSGGGGGGDGTETDSWNDMFGDRPGFRPGEILPTW